MDHPTNPEKPSALTELGDHLPGAFEALKEHFQINKMFGMDLSDIRAVSAEELSDARELAAVSMRKMQLLYLLATTTAKTTPGIVVNLCADLARSIPQLVGGTTDLSLDKRQTLVNALRALQFCCIVIGTVDPGSEITEF